MGVDISAVLPAKQRISNEKPGAADQQTDRDLRINAAFLGVADLAQVVFVPRSRECAKHFSHHQIPR